MEVTKHQFFHDGGPYHIETSPLICSVNQWPGFYRIETSFMKELRLSSPIILRKSFLACCKAEFVFFFVFFFYLLFFSRIFTIQKIAGRREDYHFMSFLPLPLVSQLDISCVIRSHRGHIAA